MRASILSTVIRFSLVLFTALACPSRASAYPVVDARHLEFTASVDDDAVAKNGRPLLDHYDLLIFLAGGASPLQTVNLGKPDTDRYGTVRLDFVSLLPVPLSPGLNYEAVVQAVGPGGTSDSERSNPFTFRPPPCDPWISPTSMSFDADAGSGIVTVNAGAGCAWTAVSDDEWLKITAGAHGTGSGTTTFTVAANRDHERRYGTLTIAGSKFRVEQDACRIVEHPKPHPKPRPHHKHKPHPKPKPHKADSHGKPDSDKKPAPAKK
jgi:hypothetical protein